VKDSIQINILKNSKELKTRELLSRKKDDIAQKRRVQEILR
jgi:hypothetical protein